MKLIIGGAYQGKLDYVRARFGLSETEIHDCLETEGLDLSKACLNHAERYIRYCMSSSADPFEAIARWTERHPDGVLICEDIFCGVVPIEPELRAWREDCGRFVNRMAGQADEVIRIFCGLPQKLK